MPVPASLKHLPKDVVETRFSVRYAETDAMGIVHHSAYVIWLEEGRSAWFRQCLNDPKGYALMENDGYAFAVTDIQMRFLASARFGDIVQVRTWVTAVKSRSLHVAYEVADANSGTQLLRAKSIHMCVNREMEVVTIPEKWMKRLKSEP